MQHPGTSLFHKAVGVGGEAAVGCDVVRDAPVPRWLGGALTEGRSHSDTRVGCMVWSTTASSSGRQGVQVHLLAQPRAECLDRLGGVVAAPVEAPVDRPLDAAAGRLEHRGQRQGRHRHPQAGVAAEQLTELQDHAGVAAAQQRGEQPVGERAADDAAADCQSAPGRYLAMTTARDLGGCGRRARSAVVGAERSAPPRGRCAQEDAARSRIARSTGLGSVVSKSISLAHSGVIAMRAICL